MCVCVVRVIVRKLTVRCDERVRAANGLYCSQWNVKISELKKKIIHTHIKKEAMHYQTEIRKTNKSYHSYSKTKKKKLRDFQWVWLRSDEDGQNSRYSVCGISVCEKLLLFYTIFIICFLHLQCNNGHNGML